MLYAKVNIDGAAHTSWSTFFSRGQNKHTKSVRHSSHGCFVYLSLGGKLITVYVARASSGFVLRSDGTELEPVPALQGPEFAEADHTLILGS